MTAFWLTAFLDLPARSFEPAVRFWSEVTGFDVSPPRGEHGEFATLVPPDADPWLKVQRLADGGPRIHLDVHVPDPRAAAREAEAMGAEIVADRGHVVIRSPGGLLACFVAHPASRTAATDEARSTVDHVCIDVPSSAHEQECGFWAAVLGHECRVVPGHPEFGRIVVPGLPVAVLVQRLGEPWGQARAHLDLVSDDRVGEVQRHAGLGAALEAELPGWTVLRDPAGSAYCITDRSPGTPQG